LIQSRVAGGYGMPSSPDQWVFAGGGSSSNPTTCVLLSWDAQ
jgi:hypothetical protein